MARNHSDGDDHGRAERSWSERYRAAPALDGTAARAPLREDAPEPPVRAPRRLADAIARLRGGGYAAERRKLRLLIQRLRYVE